MKARFSLLLGSGAAAVLVMVSGIQAGAVVASAPVRHPLAVSSTPKSPPGDPTTTVTFTVTSGTLTLSVPASINLGSGAPGTTIGPTPIGTCAVTDARALASASWTVTASETNFANGPSTIPAGAAFYTVGTVTTTGTITTTPSNITLGTTALTVLTGSAGVGNNTATWNPTIALTVPASAVGGTYTGTLTQSVA